MSLVDTLTSFASKNYDSGLVAASSISNYKSKVITPSVNASINVKDKPLSSFTVEAKGENVKATREKKLDLKTGIIIVAVVGVIGFIAIRKTDQKIKEIEK